jgi:hypothetical protein
MIFFSISATDSARSCHGQVWTLNMEFGFALLAKVAF